ncbi:MAG: hypothetical protein WAL29_12175 [Bacteroidales bacterium]
MKKWICFSILVLTLSCKENVEETYLTPEKAKEYFMRIEDLCNRDSGKLWGKNLYGPVMFVDRASRKITADKPDDEGLLKFKDGVYTGIYPRESIIGTTAVEFGGTLYAMVPLPAGEDSYRITSRAIHSLFHVFQQSNGIGSTSFNATNMDEKEARIWIKLEWKALRKAINSTGEEQLLAIRDALIFRGSNRETYPEFASIENQFEAYEGLATFTYTLFEAQSPEEYKTRLLSYLDTRYALPSYARSFGNIHGALYATLLYYKGFDFKTIVSDKIDLGNMVKELYNIKLPQVCRDVAGSISISYNLDEIMKEEEIRKLEIDESLKKQLSDFTERPVVYLELESPYFDFEPEDVHPLDTLGTIYSSMRVSDNWGKLTVDGVGCLVSNNYKFMRITARGFKSEKNNFYGVGWQLTLNDGWEMAEVDQNYYVRKLIP